MTQSKDDNEYTIDLSNMNGTTDTITITGTNDMDSSWVSVGDITASVISDLSDVGIGGINDGQVLVWNDTASQFQPGDFDGIYPSEVEKMCKEYPALEKVWRNFKSVYDMVKQDYEGKKKSGDIDD